MEWNVENEVYPGLKDYIFYGGAEMLSMFPIQGKCPVEFPP